MPQQQSGVHRWTGCRGQRLLVRHGKQVRCGACCVEHVVMHRQPTWHPEGCGQTSQAMGSTTANGREQMSSMV